VAVEEGSGEALSLSPGWRRGPLATVVGAGVLHGARLSGRAPAMRRAFWCPNLEFGAVPRPDLVGGGGRGIIRQLEVVSIGWRPVAAGVVVWSWSFAPPSPLVLPRMVVVLGVLVVFSVVQWPVPLAAPLTIDGHE
jgi:hypothetical protein